MDQQRRKITRSNMIIPNLMITTTTTIASIPSNIVENMDILPPPPPPLNLPPMLLRKPLTDVSNLINIQYPIDEKPKPRKRKYDSIIEKENENESVEDPDNSLASEDIISLSNLTRDPNDVAYDIYGYYPPPEHVRSLPLPEKGANPKYCLDLVDEMYSFYFEMQRTFHPKSYFHRQSFITPRMRSLIIDWLIEVHDTYQVSNGVLWLTVNIMDRYLEKTPDVAMDQLQLIGLTSFFIASKLDSHPCHPSTNFLVQLTASAYNKNQIVEMEKSILLGLDYQLLVPTGYHFLLYYFHHHQYPGGKRNPRILNIASYIAERNLQELEFLSFPIHLYIAASFYLALLTITSPKSNLLLWTNSLQDGSRGLTEEQVKSCAMKLLENVNIFPSPRKLRPMNAVQEKYGDDVDDPDMRGISKMKFPAIP